MMPSPPFPHPFNNFSRSCAFLVNFPKPNDTEDAGKDGREAMSRGALEAHHLSDPRTFG
jgi:hypothetical protein